MMAILKKAISGLVSVVLHLTQLLLLFWLLRLFTLMTQLHLGTQFAKSSNLNFV